MQVGSSEWCGKYCSDIRQNDTDKACRLVRVSGAVSTAVTLDRICQQTDT